MLRRWDNPTPLPLVDDSTAELPIFLGKQA